MRHEAMARYRGWSFRCDCAFSGAVVQTGRIEIRDPSGMTRLMAALYFRKIDDTRTSVAGGHCRFDSVFHDSGGRLTGSP